MVAGSTPNGKNRAAGDEVQREKPQKEQPGGSAAGNTSAYTLPESA